MSCFVDMFRLSSDTSIVGAPSLNRVFGVRMLYPAGLNAQLCCDYYSMVLSNIQGVCKKLILSVFVATQNWIVFL